MNMEMLKKSIVCITASLIVSSAIAQSNKDAVLMTVGNTKVTVAEFENVYHKNNTKEVDQKSLGDYIDLFVNFKLKVKEAEDMGLDTAKAFKEELAGYRKQLAQPYLTDKDVNEKLLEETYARMKEDINASHILVKINPNALPKDTLEAYNKIMEYRKRALKGEDFAALARESAAKGDQSAKENGGNLGYFSALALVYPFETMAYTTKVGEISMPVRTSYGYHIMKIHDRRPAQGEVLVAHIMIKTTPNMNQEDSLNAYTKVTELYNKLKAGGKFDELATQFSDDKTSAKKGGELPWFGTGKMPADFEKASFALKNKGEYCQPMRTKYGWHIIKLIDKRGIASFEEMKNDLKAKVSKDSRSQVGRTSLIAKAKAEYKLKENLKMRDEFYKVMDSSIFEGKWEATKAAKLVKPIFTLGNKTYTQKDFADYINSHQSKRAKTDFKMLIDQTYKQYVDETVVAYEESMLDSKYPEFKALMQEYRDGILLFELTDQKVWSKAVKDTLGSKEFYEKNKNNYMWDERADATIYTCSDAKIAKQVRTLMKKKKTEKEILAEVNKSSQLNLQTDSKLFTKGENEFVDKNWTPATSADILTADKKVVIVVVNKLMKPEPKPYNDAKGMVTADYQNYLEKQWVDELKKKYPVSIDKNVLSTVK